jgi:outer membrane protein OmpA-like peptidoglycan-associated protein
VRRPLPPAALALLALALAGCATGGKLRGTAEAVRADAAKARAAGALRCAPRELALAESNLAFAEAEIDHGAASRAGEHLEVAAQQVKKALELTRTCQAQVTIGEKKPVVIVKTDADKDGVPDLDDKCPDVPGKPELAGCPEARDSDGDGTSDDIDRCPLDPEDEDGFQDEDGCPDPDNDGDGIVDKVDACPATPGPIESRGCPALDRDKDGVADAADRCPDEAGVPPDGCPRKYTLVEVKKDRIAIKQQVHFATAKYRVLPDSFPLLDQVVQVLRDYPDMKVSVEGHTDSVGAQAMNMKLSQARAEAVRDYLVKKGIDAGRLQAVGHGPTKPLASNRTATGRAMNRRTEFRIVSTE